MSRPAVAALAALLSLSALPAAAQGVDPRLAQAMTICLDEFPVLTGYTHDMASAGFRREVAIRGMEFYSAYNEALIMAVLPREPGCLFGLNGQVGASAVTAAQAVVESLYGAQATRTGPTTDGKFFDGWVVPLPTGPIFIGVAQEDWYTGRFHGSLIVVMVPDQQQ